MPPRIHLHGDRQGGEPSFRKETADLGPHYKGTNPLSWPGMAKPNGHGPSPNAQGVRYGTSTPNFQIHSSQHSIMHPNISMPANIACHPTIQQRVQPTSTNWTSTCQPTTCMGHTNNINHPTVARHYTPNATPINCQHARYPPHTGFLAGGDQNPAFDPRSLIIAGDVEQNPGPTTDQICNKCKNTLTARTKHPFVCNQAQCERVCHTDEDCSGISRYSKNKTWYCTEHAHLKSPAKKSARRGKKTQTQSLGECDYCGNNLHSGEPRTCATANCEAKCHRWPKCSKIGRYSNAQWRCKLHNPQRCTTSTYCATSNNSTTAKSI